MRGSPVGEHVGLVGVEQAVLAVAPRERLAADPQVIERLELLRVRVLRDEEGLPRRPCACMYNNRGRSDVSAPDESDLTSKGVQANLQSTVHLPTFDPTGKYRQVKLQTCGVARGMTGGRLFAPCTRRRSNTGSR